MTSGPEQLAAAADALVVHSASAYSWLGQTYADAEADDPGGERLARAVAARLYADFYLTGGPAPPGDDLGRPRGPWPSPEVAALSAANAGRGCRQGGWAVRGRDGDRVVVERDGLRVWAPEDRVLGEDRAAGARVELLLPKEELGPPDGFYTAHGDAGTVGGGGARIDRVYWNVRPSGRAALTALVTAALNASGLPFRFKVLSDPRVLRCDAAVLYLTRDRREALAAVLPGVRRAIAGELRPATPALTLALAPGIGFAEDPPGEDSFGLHRCALIAGALVAPDAQGSAATRLAAVERTFAEAGIDPGHPYLDPGSRPDAAPVPMAG